MILGAKNPDCEGLRVINKNLALQNFYMTEYVYKYNIDVKNVQVMTNIEKFSFKELSLIGRDD